MFMLLIAEAVKKEYSYLQDKRVRREDAALLWNPQKGEHQFQELSNLI